MGKSFKGFSKALSLILAVAMVVTCVPTSAYAADLLAGESEDLLISNDNVAEEASDALIDASASEDNSSTSIDTQKASAPLDDLDENTAGKGEFGNDKYVNDVLITFANSTMTGDDGVYLYNGKGDATLDLTNKATGAIADNAVSGTGAAAAASEEDYILYIVNKTPGYQVAEEPITLTYYDFSEAETASAAGVAKTGDDTKQYYEVAATTGNDAWDEAGVKKVIIKKNFIDYVAKSYISDGETSSTNANAKKITVTAVAAEAKEIYVKLDLTNASGCSAAIPATNAKFKWTYNAGAADDAYKFDFSTATGSVTGLSDPDAATYTILQSGEGVAEDAANLLKPEYAPVVTNTHSAGNVDASAVGKMAEYDSTNHYLYIAADLLNNAALVGTTITIAVDTTVAVKPKYTSISLADKTTYEKYATFDTIPTDKRIDEQVAITAVAKSVHTQSNTDKDVLTDSKPVRTIYMSYSVDGGITKSNTGLTKVENTWTLAADTFTEAKDLQFFMEGTEGLVLKSNATKDNHFTIVGQSASVTDNTTNLLRPVTGETYSFTVAPKGAGCSVTKVYYRLGNSETDYNATKNSDGSWSVTTAKIEDTLTIYADVKTDGGKKNVKVSTTEMDALATVNGKTTGTAITNSGADDATEDEAYAFTVTPKATKYVSKVEYQIGTLGAKKEATLVSTDKTGVATYVTEDIVDDDLVLFLTGGDGYSITAPVNKNVTITDEEGNALEPGQKIYVDGTDDYHYGVSLASGVDRSAVTFAGLTVTRNGSDTTVTRESSDVSIAAGTYDVTMVGNTEQLVARNLFQVGWYPAAGDGALADSENIKLVRLPLNTAKADYDYDTAGVGTSDTAQALTLAGTETINLTATFKANAKVGINTDTEVKQTSSIALKSIEAADAVATLANNSTTNVIVTADNFKTGSNVLVATTTVSNKELKTGSVGDMTGNKLVFRAELPITVVPQYSSFRAVATSANTYSENQIIDGIVNTTGEAYFYVLGTNGRTKVEKTDAAVTVDGTIIKGITWTTVPDVEGAGDPDFILAANGTNSIKASAAKTSVTSISATPKIVYGDADSSEATGTAGSVKVSNNDVFGVYPKVTVSDGVTDTTVADNQAFTIAKNGTMNSLTVDYIVYKEVKAGAIAAIGTDEDKLAAAIAEGDVVEATLDAAPTFTAVNSDGTDTVYVEKDASSTGARYKVNAVKPSGDKTYNITMDAKIDGKKMTSKTIKVSVKNVMDPVTVILKIVDTTAKTDSKVNRQVLSTDPTFVGSASKVLIEASDADGTSAGTGTTYGVAYNGVSEGSVFTLPDANAFDSSKFGTGRIPKGWKCGTAYYELGATNVPVTNTEFELLWADRYAITGIYNANEKGTDGKYPVTATDLSSTAKTMNIAGKIPVEIKTTEITGIYAKDTTDADGTVHSAGDDRVTVTYLASGFDLYAESDNVFKDTDDTTKKITGTTLEGEFLGSSKVTAKWTAPDSSAKTLDSKTITVEAKKSLTLRAGSTALNTSGQLELTEGKAEKVLPIELRNNGATTGVDWDNYTFTVTVGSTTTVEKGTVVKNGSYSYILNVPLKGLSAGSTTVRIEAKDDQNNVAVDTEDATKKYIEVPIVVAAGTVKFEATKTVGTEKVSVTAIELSVENGNSVGGYDFSAAGIATLPINVRAYNKSDSSNANPLTGGTWEVSGSGVVKASPTNTPDGQGGVYVTVEKAAETAANFGEGVLTLAYTPKDETEPYVYEIAVDTYKPVVLPVAANVAIVDKDGNRVTDGATPTPANVSTFLKVFRDESETQSYVVDLQGYTAEYTDGTAKVFDGWTVSGYTSVATENATTTIDLTTGSDILGGNATNYGLDFEANGSDNSDDVKSLVLKSNFINDPIKSIEFVGLSGNTITLTDEDVSTDMTKTTNKVVLRARVTDASSIDTISIASSKIGFFKIVDDNAWTYSDTTYGGIYTYTDSGAAAGTTAISNHAVDTEKNTRTDLITLGMVKGKAGSTTLTFKSAATGNTLKTLTLNVNGAVYATVAGGGYAVGDVTGYIENGENVVSDVRTVNGNTIFFDEDGAALTASGVTYVSSINKYVLVNKVSGTKHTTYGKGVQTIAGKQYYVKDDETGEVARQELIEVSGVQRYANSEGVLVTHDMATDGKYTDPVTGITYLIDKDTNAAEEDDRMLVQSVSAFSWVPSSAKEYNHNTSVVTATVTVNFKMEKAGTTDSKVLDATVTKDTSASTSGKDVYKATVTANGYYTKDGKSEYDFSTVTDTKTYKYDPSSGQGKVDGLTVEGLTEGDEFDYTGYAIKPAFTVIDNETGATLVEKTDYTVKWTNNNPKITALPATATVTITGKGNYDKTAITRSFKIVDPTSGEDPTTYSAVKSVKVVKEAITFDGTEKFPKNLTIALADKSTVTATWNGSSYDLSSDTANVKIIVSNNINKGSGNVTVYGSDFKKPAKATFTIAAADVSTLGDALTIEPEAAVYTKTGAKAATTVKFNGTELVEGRDYKLNYVYNNKKDAGTAAGSVYITGKNNFKGNTKKTNLVNFDIEKMALTTDNVIVDAYEKVAPKSIKAKVYDSEGNEIAAKNFKIAKVEKDGADVTTSKDKLKAGDEISVTVAGVAGSNVDEETEVTVNITVAAKMSSAKFNAKALTKYYNGSVVELDSTDMEKVTATVKINKVDTTLEYGTDYEIVGYKGNNKQGTMTVYVRGISDKVSGYGKFTVKLLPKPITDADK